MSTTNMQSIINRTYKVTKSLLGFMSNGPNKVCNRCPWVRTWSQYIKNFKRTGIKFREAMLLSPAGETMAHDGESLLTDSDTKKIRDILVDGDACRDVLYLDNLYYCVKQLTESEMVLFNGANYVIACLTASKHLLIIHVRARRSDGARSVEWMQTVAEDIDTKVDPQ